MGKLRWDEHEVRVGRTFEMILFSKSYDVELYNNYRSYGIRTHVGMDSNECHPYAGTK